MFGKVFGKCSATLENNPITFVESAPVKKSANVNSKNRERADFQNGRFRRRDDKNLTFENLRNAKAEKFCSLPPVVR
jgi:hypothetical protein